MTDNLKIVLTVCFILIAIFMSVLIKDSVKMKRYIGKTYVVDKDTLSVVDYSVINGNFYMDNGLLVNKFIISNENCVEPLGDKILIGTDTLTVIRYDWFEGLFFASNGDTIRNKDIKNFKIFD